MRMTGARVGLWMVADGRLCRCCRSAWGGAVEEVVVRAAVGDERTVMLNYVRRQLVGRWGGDDELLRERPQRRYLAGILFPQGAEADTDPGLADDVVDETPDMSADDGDDPLALAGQQLPSSVGLSFVLPHVVPVCVEVRAARYLPEGDGWRRGSVSLTA